LRYVRVSEKK